MDEQQLIEFVNWLPTVVPELKDAKPEEIVQMLNEMYESEEGQTALSQLISAFEQIKNSDQSLVFKKGGKMDQLYKKKLALKAAKMGMANKVVELAQDGTKISRRDAINQAMQNQGYTRAQARQAYNNQLDALKNQGFSGREMRQAARQNIVGTQPSIQSTTIVGVGEKPSWSDFHQITTATPIKGIDDLPSQRVPTPIVPNYDNLSFKQAFRQARNAGDKTFTWRGGDYTTELAKPEDQKEEQLSDNKRTFKDQMKLEGQVWKTVLRDIIFKDAIEALNSLNFLFKKR